MNATIASIAEITSVLTVWNATTEMFTSTFTMAGGFGATVVQIRCFMIKSGIIPAGVTQNGAYNDSWIILGAKPIRSAADVFNSMTQDASNICISKAPTALSTLDSVYIHMNTIETGSYMSTNFESRIEDHTRLIESSIFAKIPVDNTSELITFEDHGNSTFQSFLARKHVDNLDIRVTDGRGRSLGALSDIEDLLLSFKIVLRWDLFAGPPLPFAEKRPSLKLDHPPIA